MFISPKTLFEKAAEGGYAVGAFNVNNMELTQAIMEAAVLERAPLILQISEGARKYANPIYLKKIIEAAVELNPEIPVVTHLDHGKDFEICKAAIDEGYQSVMIDASSLPFEENIALTKKVADYAHKKGVWVEAELGRLAGVEDWVNVEAREAAFTGPEQAAEFVEKTGCDSLAIAIGTSHGAYKFKGESRLDFERLEKIREKLPENYPLVLHGASSVPAYLVEEAEKYGAKLGGASGVSDEMLARAAKEGIRKINTDTDLRLAMTAAIRKVFAENPADFDPRKYLGPARETVRDLVRKKMREFGCSGKI